MYRKLLLAVGGLSVLALAGCSVKSTDGAGGGTASSSSSGGGAGGSSASSSGAGQGGVAQGGNGQGGSGGAGECIGCGTFITECQTDQGCPPEDSLCENAVPLLDALGACICGDDVCKTDCPGMCTGQGEDGEACDTCSGEAIAGACKAEFGACGNDV
ncbi:MAG: hypothetical protein HY744_30240 [Deltaproteobacteria bacterium]|nr:hypothetical protein [Deltaproteobacteria bacterium]